MRKICPLMTGPVFAHYNEDDRGPETLEAPCVGSRCPAWKWTSRSAVKTRGRCGYLGGGSFTDPAQCDDRGRLMTRTDGGGP